MAGGGRHWLAVGWGEEVGEGGGEEEAEPQGVEGDVEAVILHFEPADEVGAEKAAGVAEGVDEADDGAHDVAREGFAGDGPEGGEGGKGAGDGKAEEDVGEPVVILEEDAGD